MDVKSKAINFFENMFSPGNKETGVLAQYQKIDLDNQPVQVYTGDTRADKYIGKIMMEEAKKPTVTVETIVNAVENKYPKVVVELAKILRDMKVQYSLHASAFSAKLFDAQDTLGLTSEEVRDIMDEIISQKDVIIQTTQASIDIIYKPK